MEQERRLPHKLTLTERKQLSLTGVLEVIRFDESAVVLNTSLGVLTVHGQGLQMKNLSLEGGQVAVEGEICAFLYEQSPKSGPRRRLFG